MQDLLEVVLLGLLTHARAVPAQQTAEVLVDPMGRPLHHGQITHIIQKPGATIHYETPGQMPIRSSCKLPVSASCKTCPR